MNSLRSPLRTWLRLEQLEGREVPAAPVLSGLSMRLIGSYLVVTGNVQDENPGQAQVNISGAASGAATVFANGSFEYIQSSSGGTINAVAHDIEGYDSSTWTEVVEAPLNNVAPYITLTEISKGPNKQITVTGKVYDENPSGLTVTFSNAASGTTTTGAGGNFTATLTASMLGELRAQTVDREGLQSNIATIDVTNTKPVITGFTFTSLGNRTFRFTGHVSDDWCNVGLVVQFGSTISAVNGQSAVTDSGGNFSLTVEIPEGVVGDVWVTVTDCWGLTSDVVTRYFS